MSIEAILKASKQKQKKKSKKLYGGIAAVDSRYTGEEPVWDGWQEWTVDKFMEERNRALNFYNYYSDNREMKKFVIEWMEANGYTKDNVRAVKQSPDYALNITTCSLCKSMLRGMPPMHPNAQEYHDRMPGIGGTARSDELFVRDSIAEAIKLGQSLKEDDGSTIAKGPSGPSPMERLQVKTRATIIMDLDVLLDKWMDSGDAVEVLPIFEKMKDYGLSAPSVAQVERWILKQRDEMLLAYEKKDEQVVEGYSYLSNKQLKARIDACETMLEDLNKFRNSAKAQRAPRTPKPINSTKQISKMQYLKDSAEYKITSINPVRIVGAHRLLVFNVKYRSLFDFYASSTSGFSIKGTTIKNVDELKTRAIRLRKPEDFLDIAQNNTPKQINKAWEKLTTKEFKPKHRINKEMILLRVFEQPTE